MRPTHLSALQQEVGCGGQRTWEHGAFSVIHIVP